MHCMLSKLDDDPLIKFSISFSVIKSALPTLIVNSKASNLNPQRAAAGESPFSCSLFALSQVSFANPLRRQREMSSTTSDRDFEQVQAFVALTSGFLLLLEKLLRLPPTLLVFEFMIIIIIIFVFALLLLSLLLKAIC